MERLTGNFLGETDRIINLGQMILSNQWNIKKPIMTLILGMFLFDRPLSYDIKSPRENSKTFFGQATNKNCIISMFKCYPLVFNFQSWPKHWRHGCGCKTEWKGKSPEQGESHDRADKRWSVEGSRVRGGYSGDSEIHLRKLIASWQNTKWRCKLSFKGTADQRRSKSDNRAQRRQGVGQKQDNRAQSPFSNNRRSKNMIKKETQIWVYYLEFGRHFQNRQKQNQLEKIISGGWPGEMMGFF